VTLPARKAQLAVLSVLLAAVVLAATACGSKDSAPSTTADWAGGVCSAITTYKTALTDTATSVKSNPSKSGLQDAANAAKSATDTFVSDVKGLGKPDTTAGQQAKDTIDTLSTNLNKDISTIEDAAGTGGLQSISVIAGALATAQTQLKSAVSTLKGLDTQGELSSAFKQAPSCASLT
jgi:hypothetical protein